MFDLTPGERRGALVVLALFALGALWDVGHIRPAMAPPVPRAPAVAEGHSALAPAEADPAAAGAVRAPAASVDINAASAAELDALPRIGPVLAQRIVAYREAHGAFRSTDELLAVRGIGPRLMERLAPLVVAGASRNGARSGVRNATPAPR